MQKQSGACICTFWVFSALRVLRLQGGLFNDLLYLHFYKDTRDNKLEMVNIFFL